MELKIEEVGFNEITDPQERLDISQFELGDDKNSKSRKLLRYALYNLIEKYSILGKRGSEKEGIYYSKEDKMINTLFLNNK